MHRRVQQVAGEERHTSTPSDLVSVEGRAPVCMQEGTSTTLTVEMLACIVLQNAVIIIHNRM